MVEHTEHITAEMKLELEAAARREAEMKDLASQSEAERVEEEVLRVAAKHWEAEVRWELDKLRTKLAKVSMLLASGAECNSPRHNPQLQGR